MESMRGKRNLVLLVWNGTLKALLKKTMQKKLFSASAEGGQGQAVKLILDV